MRDFPSNVDHGKKRIQTFSLYHEPAVRQTISNAFVDKGRETSIFCCNGREYDGETFVRSRSMSTLEIENRFPNASQLLSV